IIAMSELFNQHTLAEALTVDVPVAISIASVEIDSRKVTPGALFVGVSGEKHNGSDFAESALQNGAVLCIIDKKPTNYEQIKDKCILLPNSLVALEELATYARNRLKATVIGLTGSV